MAIIKLTKGYEAIVDDSRFEELNKFNWSTQEGYYSIVYAIRFTKQDEWPVKRRIGLHHQVLDIMPWELNGKVVDHIDRNTLNCREENLRLVTHAGNSANSKRVLNARGVAYHKRSKKYQAYLTLPGKPTIHLGMAATEEEALRLVAEAKQWSATV